MTNAEKYVDEILNKVKWARETCLCPFSYAVERISGISSNDLEKVLKWLFSEYEPPLLENGDNLKVGDYIMVRSDDKGDWLKRRFCFFYKDQFYCAKWDPNSEAMLTCVGRSYARLPEEGE